MCRLLAVKSETDFKISSFLHSFAHNAKNSKEYQGHGWGCSWREQGEWQHYKNILPIWEDNLEQFGTTDILIAHARSAFRDRDIKIENNMPFYDDKNVFIFNGELHGVKIKEKGRIGAEKIFNFIKRFDRGSIFAALEKALPIIEKRSKYIKAINIIIARGNKLFVSSLFNENPEYFTMHYKKSPGYMQICSEPFSGEDDWNQIANRSFMEF